MSGYVRRHFAVGHPEAGEAGLAAENHGLVALAGSGVILLPAHRKVHFDVLAGAPRLTSEVFGKVFGIAEIVAVNVDQHAEIVPGPPPYDKESARIRTGIEPHCRRVEPRGSGRGTASSRGYSAVQPVG